MWLGLSVMQLAVLGVVAALGFVGLLVFFLLRSRVQSYRPGDPGDYTELISREEREEDFPLRGEEEVITPLNAGRAEAPTVEPLKEPIGAPAEIEAPPEEKVPQIPSPATTSPRDRKGEGLPEDLWAVLQKGMGSREEAGGSPEPPHPPRGESNIESILQGISLSASQEGGKTPEEEEPEPWRGGEGKEVQPPPPLQAEEDVGFSEGLRRLLISLSPGEQLILEELGGKLSDEKRSELERVEEALIQAEERGGTPGWEDYYRLGFLTYLDERFLQASRYLKTALRLSESLVPVLNLLAAVNFALGKDEAALSYLREAVREGGGPEGARRAALCNLGFIYARRHSLERAAECYRSALSLSGGGGEERLTARILGRLGSLSFERGRLQEAYRYHQEAMKRFEAMGEREGLARELGAMATVLRAEGKLEEAHRHLEAALGINRELGNAGGEASNLGQLGVVYSGMQKLDEALESYSAALSLNRRLGNLRGEAANTGNMANVHYLKGELEKALELHHAALAINQKLGHRLGEATSLGNIGRVQKDLGKREEALKLLERAIEIFKEEGAEGHLEKVKGIMEEITET